MASPPLPVLDDDELQKIYVWVDSVPLSRPKRNISRDFSDGGEDEGGRTHARTAVAGTRLARRRHNTAAAAARGDRAAAHPAIVRRRHTPGCCQQRGAW
jgi:hypothetical protein